MNARKYEAESVTNARHYCRIFALALESMDTVNKRLPALQFSAIEAFDLQATLAESNWAADNLTG